MIHIVYGENDFLVQEKVIEISKNNYKIISCKNKDWRERLANEANQKLWGSKAFLVLPDYSEKHNNILEWVQNSSIELIFIFEAKPEWLLKLLKEAKTKHSLYQTENLKSKKVSELKNWLENLLKQNQVKLEPSAVQVLAEIFLTSPALLLRQVQKLANYKTNQLITNDELKELVRWPNESKAYEVANLLREKNLPKFYHYLAREILLMKNHAQELPRLFGLLASTIFNLLLVKKAAAANELASLQLNAFHKKILLQTSHKYTELELKNLYNIIAQVEKRYKKYQVKPLEITEEMMLMMFSNV